MVIFHGYWAFQRQGCFTSQTIANSTMAREAGRFGTCCFISHFSNLHMARMVPTSGLPQAERLSGPWHFEHPAGSVSQPRTISISSTICEKSSLGKYSPKRRLPWGFPEPEWKTGGKTSLAADAFTPLCWGSLGENCYDSEHTETDLRDLNPFGQPTFPHFKTLIWRFNLFYQSYTSSTRFSSFSFKKYQNMAVEAETCSHIQPSANLALLAISLPLRNL